MAQDGITPGEIPDGLAGEASTARAVIDDHGKVTGWSEASPGWSAIAGRR
jgi:hypothetical protein